jgi:LysM repeat protein
VSPGRAGAGLVLILLLAAGCSDPRYDLGETAVPTTAPVPLTAPVTTVPEVTPTTYVLGAGDTLGELAGRFDTTVEALMEINDLEDATSLLVGDVIVIPPPPTVPTGEGGAGIR